MEIATVLKNAQGGAAINNLASAFGADPTKIGPAVNSMLADLSRRIERDTFSRGGLADIVKMLGDDTAGRALSEPRKLASPEVIDSGNGVLDVLIGNKHISRGIAARAAAESGIDAEVLKKMLPVVASMMVGGLQQKTQGVFANRLQGVQGIGDVATLHRGTSPLPIPGDNIPGVGRPNRYDDLGEVIRRGGTPAPGGGNLEGMIRSILGGLLGFQNRGLLGTLLQWFVITMLPKLLKRIFSPAAAGR